jgi:hypothetical protein
MKIFIPFLRWLFRAEKIEAQIRKKNKMLALEQRRRMFSRTQKGGQ